MNLGAALATILFVDDEAALRRPFTTFLRDNTGWEVTDCGDGTTALDLLRKTRFDLLILDLQLGDMNGFDVLRTMRREGLTVGKVLVISGDPDTSLRNMAETLGVSATLEKPFTLQELFGTVQMLTTARS